MNTAHIILKTSLLLALLALCPGCGDTPDNAQAAKAKAPEPVTLLLNWYPEVEHGGYFSAQADGYYAGQNLDVDIQDGGPSAPVMQKVAGGDLVFGIANADDVVNAQAADADIVALLAPIQVNPRCIMVRADSGIREFTDLKDMTLAMSPRPSFSHYLKKKFALDKVRIVPYPSNIQTFLTEKNFAQQAYNFSEPFLAEKQGVAVRVLMVADTGFNPYASVLVTRRKTITEHPELVRKMVRASALGWLHYLKSPDAANQMINKQNPLMGLDCLNFGVEKLAPMVLTDEAQASGLGTMRAERWKILVEQMTWAGIVKPGVVDPEKIYNNKF